MDQKQAVVIGASVAGLLAASALAPHFTQVTLLDRDRLPIEPVPRRAVPQARHAHGLHPGGLAALEKLYPGIVDELVDAGATSGDLSANVQWFIGGGQLASREAGLPCVGVSRARLEHLIRSRVAKEATIRDEVEVVRLVGQLNGRGPARVVGVELTNGERIDADLVVDASGRSSRLPDWLAPLGCPPPVEDKVHCNMVYVSGRWRPDPDTLAGDIISVTGPAADPIFGVLIAEDADTVVTSVGGLMGHAPARDLAAYREFVGELPNRRLSDVLASAEPVGSLHAAHFPYSVRRRYDRLKSFPAGLVAMGDAVASVNPMYGQGMSIAALQAVALGEELERGLRELRLQRRAHRIVDVAWKICTGGDLRYPGVEGKRTPDQRVMNGYLDRLTVAARTDDELARRFLRVAGFLDRPESLFKPGTLWRTFRGAR